MTASHHQLLGTFRTLQFLFGFLLLCVLGWRASYNNLPPPRDAHMPHDHPADSGRYGPVLDALPDLAWVAAPDGTVEYMNRQCRSYFGLPLDDLLGWDWEWVVHPADLSCTLAAWTTSVREFGPYAVEYRLRRHDGEYRWHLGRACPLRGPAGDVVRWFGTCIDVDNSKRTENALLVTRAQFRALVERSDDGFALVGADRVVRYASAGAGRILGHIPEVVVGTRVCDWVHPDDRAKLSGWLEFLLATPGMRSAVEARLRYRDGSHRRVEVRATNLLPDPDVRAAAFAFREVPEEG
ncbi:MAG: lov [Gemmataceae bacterium]|nr:lov [Gemmataceae bacterium]